MARPVAPPGWLARVLCGTLAVWAVANVLTGLAAWNRYQLLLALPSEHVPRGSEALVTADMWLGNLMGWREAAFVIPMLLLIAWLDDMRGRADGAWPQGQRRSRAWLIFAWVLPVGNLFTCRPESPGRGMEHLGHDAGRYDAHGDVGEDERHDRRECGPDDPREILTLTLSMARHATRGRTTTARRIMAIIVAGFLQRWRECSCLGPGLQSARWCVGCAVIGPPVYGVSMRTFVQVVSVCYACMFTWFSRRSIGTPSSPTGI